MEEEKASACFMKSLVHTVYAEVVGSRSDSLKTWKNHQLVSDFRWEVQVLRKVLLMVVAVMSQIGAALGHLVTCSIIVKM